MSQTLRNENFVRYLVANYTHVKDLFPQEGRRRWHLRVLQIFWAENHDLSPNSQISRLSADEFIHDDDPLDELTNGEELGIIVRTDYSDDSAWEKFLSKLKAGEEEINIFLANGDEDSCAEEHADDMDDSASEESADTPPASPLIKIINATSPELRTLFNNISNLAALRLLNNVDIRRSPAPQTGTTPINPPHRLIDQGGWQEIYTGHTLWIYDAQSNIDQCVRLVRGQSDIYGTATGDSWRARATHVHELQFNMSHLGMEINFGGLDRWDFSERKKNLEEAASFR